MRVRPRVGGKVLDSHQESRALLVTGPQQSQVDSQRETFAWPLGRPNDRLKNGIMPDLRYPIGPFEAGPALDMGNRFVLLSQLAEVPSRLQAAVAGLSESQLDTPYRPAGWTVRRVVHHLSDTDELVCSNQVGPHRG
jgi:hypothetical protein